MIFQKARAAQAIYSTQAVRTLKCSKSTQAIMTVFLSLETYEFQSYSNLET